MTAEYSSNSALSAYTNSYPITTSYRTSQDLDR